MHGDQAGDAAALQIFAAHGVAGALRRDHRHVEILARLDQVEVDVEAVGEQQGRALLEIGGKVIRVDFALQFVGRQHHDDIGPFGGLGHLHDLQPGAFRLGGGGRALAQRHRHVRNAAFLEIQGVGEALAAIADNGDVLAFDQIKVGVPVVINAHFLLFP